MLNALLHEFVNRLAHHSEADRDALHQLVDETVPPDDADDAPDDAPEGADVDASTPPAVVAGGTPTPAKAK